MFFTFREYTINLNHIVSITWEDKETTAGVVMLVGEGFDIDGEDYWRFKEVIGVK